MMTEQKITKEMVLNGLISFFEGDNDDSIAAEDVIAYCQNELALIERRRAKDNERRRKKREENTELYDAVSAAMTNELQSREEITAAVVEATGDAELTVAKVGAQLNKLVKNGVVVKDNIKANKKGYMLNAAE